MKLSAIWFFVNFITMALVLVGAVIVFNRIEVSDIIKILSMLSTMAAVPIGNVAVLGMIAEKRERRRNKGE